VVADKNEDFVQGPEIDLGGGGAQLDCFEAESHFGFELLATVPGSSVS